MLQRILHISNSPYRSLTETGPTYPIFRELAADAVEYHVLAQNVRRRFSTDREHDLYLHLVPALTGREFFFLSSAALYLVPKHRIDGILCQDPVLGGVSGFEAARLHDVPLMAEVHSDVYFRYLESDSPTRRAVGRLARRVLRHATKVRVTGPSLARKLTAIGVEPSRMAHVPYRVDIDFFAPDKVRRADARLALGFEANIVIVSVGRFVEQKGYLALISAFADVAAACPAARLVLAGGGPLQATYEALADRHGIRAALRVLPWISRDEQRALLAASDVYVQPSLAGKGEWMPRALLEAMAMGVPLVASEVGGMADVIREGRSGLLVPPGDLQRLAAVLRSLIDDQCLRLHLGAQGRVEAEAQYGWRENFARYRDALYSMDALTPG